MITVKFSKVMFWVKSRKDEKFESEWSKLSNCCTNKQFVFLKN